MLKKIGTFALLALAAALVLVGVLIYKSSQVAAQSVSSATAGSGNLNKMAGQISNALSSFGINGPSA